MHVKEIIALLYGWPQWVASPFVSIRTEWWQLQHFQLKFWWWLQFIWWPLAASRFLFKMCGKKLVPATVSRFQPAQGWTLSRWRCNWSCSRPLGCKKNTVYIIYFLRIKNWPLQYRFHPEYQGPFPLAIIYPKDCFLSLPACPRWAAVCQPWWCWAWTGTCSRCNEQTIGHGNGCYFTSGIRASNPPTKFPSL